MIKNRKNITIFIILIVICSIVFYDFLNMHYATDTYNIIDRGYEEYAIKYSLNDGRIFMCTISLIANFFNLPINIYIIALTLLSIVTSCLSIILLKNIIEKIKKPKSIFEEVILTIICFTIIFNFMFLENMQFAECFVMSISILLYIIAANILTSSNEKNYILKSTLLVILGVLFYQGTLGFFVVITVIFSLIKEEKLLLKNLLISGIICVVSAGVNLIQIKLCGMLLGMEQTRFGSIKNVLYMINYIMNSLGYILINTAGIYPKYLFMLFFIITIILTNLYLTKKESIWNFFIILLTIITIGASFAINIFTLAGFGTARMLFTLGALIGNIFLLIYAKTNVTFNRKCILSFVIILYCLTILINYMYIINKHTDVEKLTKEECKVIKSYIIEYEKTTGKKVEKIAIYSDSNPTYYYANIKNYSALCIRPLSVEWGDNGAINYWCNKKLKEIKPTGEIYNMYFAGKDWNKLAKEQFVFIDNVMHYCIY